MHEQNFFRSLFLFLGLLLIPACSAFSTKTEEFEYYILFLEQYKEKNGKPQVQKDSDSFGIFSSSIPLGQLQEGSLGYSTKASGSKTITIPSLIMVLKGWKEKFVINTQSLLGGIYEKEPTGKGGKLKIIMQRNGDADITIKQKQEQIANEPILSATMELNDNTILRGKEIVDALEKAKKKIEKQIKSTQKISFIRFPAFEKLPKFIEEQLDNKFIEVYDYDEIKSEMIKNKLPNNKASHQVTWYRNSYASTIGKIVAFLSIASATYCVFLLFQKKSRSRKEHRKKSRKKLKTTSVK